MKRKKEEKHYYKKSVFLYGTNFKFTTLAKHDISVNNVSGRKHFKIHFYPPLNLKFESYLEIFDVKSNRNDICLNLTSKTNKHLVEKDFVVYETHAITQNGKVMYIALQDTQLNGNITDRILNPVFDYGINFHKRYIRLKYIPPDGIDGVNASVIPQTIPLYSKLSGSVTSSSVQKYLGYFADKKQEKITPWVAVRMRLGSLRENYMTEAYLKHYPNRQFIQTGYTVHPRNPQGWGASPDGLILMEDGITQRTIEFKASQYNCIFKGYQICQVLWEMACLNTDAGELVVYCEKKSNSNSMAVMQCKVATLYMNNHTDLQKRIEKLVTQKELGAQHEKVRKELDKIANNIKYTTLEVPTKRIKAMKAHKNNVIKCEIPQELRTDKLISDIEDKQLQILQWNKSNRNIEFKQLVYLQIENYKKLLK